MMKWLQELCIVYLSFDILGIVIMVCEYNELSIQEINIIMEKLLHFIFKVPFCFGGYFTLLDFCVLCWGLCPDLWTRYL